MWIIKAIRMMDPLKCQELGCYDMSDIRFFASVHK
jgi:hypothetical protein